MDETTTPPVPGVDAPAPAASVGDAMTAPATPAPEVTPAPAVGFEDKSISEQIAELNARLAVLETAVPHPQSPETASLAEKVHTLYRTIFGSAD